MSRINLKIFKLSWWQWLLALVFLWLLIVIWPIKSLLLPHNWWGTNLIVVMNDNEARPCGGFATAYGTLRLPVFKLDIGSTYELNKDLGSAPTPLGQVSERLYFWDLSHNLDQKQCADDFKAGYFANTAVEVNRVILVPMSFLERWAKLLGSHTFFADISRQVANIDHHDEASLETRKDPAGALISAYVKKTIFNPFKWRNFTNLVRSHRSMFYHRSIDPDISIVEWNLGGGKSSRYLRKQAHIDLREVSPKQWTATVQVLVDHLGQYDAPLSQAWKGQIAIDVFGQTQFIAAEIKPGESWHETLKIPLTIVPTSAQIYTPKIQKWATYFSVSALAGQTLKSRSLKTKESVGQKNHRFKKPISWEILPDTDAPFLTLHKPIDANLLTEDIRTAINWAAGDLVTELHFNETIKVTQPNFQLKDRNFTLTEIVEDPTFKGFSLLDDQATLLLNWSQNQHQKDERFYLTLGGIEDVWGNVYVNEPRTIITR